MSSSFPYNKAERLLSVERVSLSYGNSVILRDVTIAVQNIVRPGMQQGQVIALLGPSGVGKTQMFRCLAGLQKPTSGVIRVTEKLVPVEAGMVGVVAQNYRLFRHRTVLGNLVVAAVVRGVSEKDASQKALDLLNQYGLGSHKDVYPEQLSGGQRQRVAILQQIISSDELLLMDEPFSGLDPIMKDKACNTILDVSRLDERGTTIVVTHDIESAVAIADTVWLMGRSFGPDGKSLGATIVKTYDLIEEGLAWEPNIQSLPRFHEVVVAVRNEFKNC